MKIFVAIPTFDGKICVPTVRALLNEQAAASASGHELQTVFLPGCSLITQARNQLCADFLASDADRLVFIDADVSWEIGSLIRLALHPVHVVGGCYRAKQDEIYYPFHVADETGWRDPRTGLTPVKMLPGGFLAISREALETMRERAPDRDYSFGGHEYHGWFEAPVRGGVLYGEDAAFCIAWAAAGGVVWLDPDLTLTHTGGTRDFTGRIAEWLDENADAVRARIADEQAARRKNFLEAE